MPQRARGARATTKGATGPKPSVSAVILEMIPGTAGRAAAHVFQYLLHLFIIHLLASPTVNNLFGEDKMINICLLVENDYAEEAKILNRIYAARSKMIA
jgi:hypothetical protein